MNPLARVSESSKVWVPILAGIVVVGVVSIASFAIGLSLETARDQHNHAAALSHAGMDQRVTRLEADIAKLSQSIEEIDRLLRDEIKPAITRIEIMKDLGG